MAAASRRRPNYHDLTDRQRRIYDFIKDANDLRGYPHYSRDLRRDWTQLHLIGLLPTGQLGKLRLH